MSGATEYLNGFFFIEVLLKPKMDIRKDLYFSKVYISQKCSLLFLSIVNLSLNCQIIDKNLITFIFFAYYIIS